MRRTAWGCGGVGTLVLALLYGVIGSAPLGAQEEDLGIAVGATAPAVLVEFWATWCPICKALLPKVEAARRRYGDRVEFLVVAVAVNESQNSVRRHLSQNPMPFTFLWDADGAAVRAFQAPATSYIVVLDANGKVVYTGIGEDQDVEAAVKKGLQGR